MRAKFFKNPIFVDCDSNVWEFDHDGDLIGEASNPYILLSDDDDIRLFRDFIDAEIARREAADKGEQG